MISTRAELIGNVPDYEGIFTRYILNVAPRKIRSRMKEKLHEEKHGRIYPRHEGEGFTAAHRASAEGEAPAGDSGDLERSLTIVQKASMEAAIESALGYAGRLEFEMNRPMWGAALDETIPIIENDLIQAMS